MSIRLASSHYCFGKTCPALDDGNQAKQIRPFHMDIHSWVRRFIDLNREIDFLRLTGFGIVFGGASMSLLEVAASTLVGAEQRIEIAARNVANSSTPGYKREIAYAEFSNTELARGASIDLSPTIRAHIVAEQGLLVESGRPLDLAISGEAVMIVRDGDRLLASRGGSFALTADATLADGQGRLLQQAGGGDLVLDGPDPVILRDGTVLVHDTPVAAVALYELPRGDVAELTPGAIEKLEESTASEIRQGMLERSNVTLSDEMIALIQAQRFGESAAQIIRTYDQLMDQAATTFGRRNG